MKALAAASLIASTLAACGPGPTVAELEQIDPALFSATPTYEVDIKGLLETYCVACHDSGGLRNGGVELDQYDSAYSARAKNLCVSITEEVKTRLDLAQRCSSDGRRAWRAYSMPLGAKSRMTLPEQVLFARWVLTGAPK